MKSAAHMNRYRDWIELVQNPCIPVTAADLAAILAIPPEFAIVLVSVANQLDKP